MKNKYYISAHINPLKNEIFYIGKGFGNRAFIKVKRSKFWNDTVSKYGLIVDIIETDLNEDEALIKEQWYINRIGRCDLDKGPLVNHTDGGEGISNPSDLTRIKIGSAMRGKVHSIETKEKMSLSQTGRETSESHRENLRKATTGFKHSEESKIKMKETNKGKNKKYNTEEDRLNARKESVRKYRNKLKNK